MRDGARLNGSRIISGFDQDGRVLRAGPGIAIDVCVAENSAQQVDTEIPLMGVGNYDVGLTRRRHHLMLGARKWAFVAQIFQFADELSP